MTDFRRLLLTSAAPFALAFNAHAAGFDIPGGDLTAALNAYSAQSGVHLMVSTDVVRGLKTNGVKGDLSPEKALSKILSGTGLTTSQDIGGGVAIVRAQHSSDVRDTLPELRLAQATPAPRAVETVTVTSSKLGGADVQSIPIAITALSQEELTSRQVAGGPDLIKEVPNLTFTKTNFTGYSIQIRGIGTQAISVTTDPAVAVAFNDTPFIRNHFFEQEFYDVSQVEVLRGPQGTLYGRNATAGVVNVTSAKPTDQFEAMASADIGNYKNRRFEAMLNLPIVGDKVDLRLAGEWTKRDGYSFNTLTDSPIDGRDLWSGRVSLRWKPLGHLTANFVWEHFQENDDRIRSSKQLCKRDTGPTQIGGIVLDTYVGQAWFSQGCLPASLYSPDSFGVPDGFSLPYYGGFISAGGGAIINPLLGSNVDPYASTTQSHDLRVIESTLNPQYKASNDTLELNAEYQLTPVLTIYSASGYNHDFLRSTEDYNRFNTQPGIFAAEAYGVSFDDPAYNLIKPDGNYRCQDGYVAIGMTCDAAGHPGGLVLPTGYFCDPQLGCSNRLVAEDLSGEHAWQVSQELRVASNFDGPFNFSLGGNYLHYETEENYYVFINTLTMFSAIQGEGGRHNPWNPGVSDNSECLSGHRYPDLAHPGDVTGCLGYIDPNPITSLNNQGHNYFLSQNPYSLNSYAMFGEAYYNIAENLKLTGGLRWTDDQKHFNEIPSEIFTSGYGYPSAGVADQEWREWTGRFVADWTPKLDFTDQTMVYASYAHGYKAGGANPPGAEFVQYQGSPSDIAHPVHPLTFKPEFDDAFELGTKNTLFDGGLTVNANVFYYDYKGYQISQIVDRTSVNLNFDAKVHGAELQATWSPIPGLNLALAGGYEDTRINDGQSAIDLADRTAGNPNWVLMKPFVTQASNCILPVYVLVNYMSQDDCGLAYNSHLDPVTGRPYTSTLTDATNIHGDPLDPLYQGFDPLAGTAGDPYTGQNTYNGIDYGPVPNNGEGFAKPLGGKELPNAPHYTVSLTADYTMPVSPSWAATLHGDFYWQSQSWARVFNAVNDKIHGYSTVNAALILTNASGWQIMGYVKNVFDKTAITGTFLNSDDTGLSTNIFLTDPRLYGVRITKNFDGRSDQGYDLFGSEKPQVWLTFGGDFVQLRDNWQKFTPSFVSTMPADLPNPVAAEYAPRGAFDWEGKLSIQPRNSEWILKAGVRFGRSFQEHDFHKSLQPVTANNIALPAIYQTILGLPSIASCTELAAAFLAFNNSHLACPIAASQQQFVDARASSSEQHTIVDFTIGKEVGLGLFGEGANSNINAGIRIAQFNMRAHAEFNSEPFYNLPETVNPFGGASAKYGAVYDGVTNEKRNFRGIGPEITWDANLPIWGDEANGSITLDLGLNAAVLFGRQKAEITQSINEDGTGRGAAHIVGYSTTYTFNRSRRVTVPNLGGYMGASARYRNAKISLGYRADEFFGPMDGGQETAKDYNRGFYGPYLNVSLGL